MNSSPYLNFWWTGELTVSEAALISWARAQRLLPLLGWRAEQEGWSLSPMLQQAVQEARYRALAEQLSVKRQINDLLAICDSLDIPLVIVKGIAAGQYYPDLAWRSYRDLDILASLSAAARLQNALEEVGYRVTYAGQRAWHLPALTPPHSGFKTVEVHTAMARDQMGELLFTFSQLQNDLIDRDQFKSLDVVNHLLVLIHHQVIHHQFEIGFLPFLDGYFLTLEWGMEEWQALATEAARRKLLESVGLFLALEAWFLANPIPIEIKSLFPTPPDAVLAASKDLLVKRGKPTPHIWRDLPTYTVSGWLRYLSLVLLGDPKTRQGLSWKERVRFYLQRPFGLAANHIPALWRLISGDPESRAAWQARRELMTWLRAEEGL
ncbi:MAG TPA: nucleotidyltransferase family protein [Thermoflexia bacterium]|nr:nucleotidyltransferase family protein [Thermoflexia bacterium]